MRLTAVLFCVATLTCSAYAGDPDTEWHDYGKDPAGSRYASLDQINSANVGTLSRAWTYRTGDIARRGAAHYAECTPLVVDGVMYMITPFSRLIAIDAATGEERWRFTPDPPLGNGEGGGGGLASRGVTYWESGEKRRIFLPVRDGRVYSIDIITQMADPEFGEAGYINLRDNVPGDGRYLFLSSPPTVSKDVLVQPYGMNDTSAQRIPYVPIRAYDAHTGALRWRFDTIPRPGQPNADTWAGDSGVARGGANPWSIISQDAERGILYVPTGAPNTDKYGGDRAGINLYSNCILALDARTGTRIWHFQMVHHDLWDYDMPAMPNVIDLPMEGKIVPAVAVVGKTGFVYLFNRLNGEPIHPIEERPVPQSNFGDEAATPTQPFPVKPPPFARQFLDADGLHTLDAERNAALREEIADYRSEGIFTPPTEQGTIVYPGQLGGGNWSGAAVDPTGMIYVTANEMPYVVSISKDSSPFGVTYGVRHFRDSAGYPASAPPWGTLTKIDLAKGEIVWQIPLGEYEELSAQGIPPTGTMNFGGATVTAGGVVFAAGTMDGKFRAFSADTGEVLYESQMEAAGYGAPVTYLDADGKQYVAIFAGGGGKAGTKPGDYVIAFSLGN